MTDTTPRGITYPEAGDHTRLWEHMQTLAEDADDLITAMRAPDRSIIERSSVAIPNGSNTAMSGGWSAGGGHSLGTSFAYGAGVVSILRPMIALHTVYVSWVSNTTGVRRLDYDIAGTVTRESTSAAGGGGNTGQTLTAIGYHGGTTDTCSLSLYQTSGGSLDAFFMRWVVVPLAILP